MKILFLTHYFPPEVNAPAVRTYEHCRRWVEAGHEVTVLTCVPNAPRGKVFSGYKNKWIQKEVMDGIIVVRLWSFLAANKGFLLRIINYISSMVMMTGYSIFLRLKYDRLVATSPQFFTGWAGVIISKFKKIPFILEIRDIWPESILSVGAMKKSLIIRVLEKMEIIMYQQADHIVTLGNGYLQNIIDKGIGVEKISVVTNGVDTEQFNPDKFILSE
jgi:glycosyltransferase involved in cell wall biosynthesis